MLTFVARRLLLAIPVLLGVVFVVMLTVELIPGDAVALMLGEHATPDALEVQSVRRPSRRADEHAQVLLPTEHVERLR